MKNVDTFVLSTVGGVASMRRRKPVPMREVSEEKAMKPTPFRRTAESFVPDLRN